MALGIRNRGASFSKVSWVTTTGWNSPPPLFNNAAYLGCFLHSHFSYWGWRNDSYLLKCFEVDNWKYDAGVSSTGLEMTVMIRYCETQWVIISSLLDIWDTWFCRTNEAARSHQRRPRPRTVWNLLPQPMLRWKWQIINGCHPWRTKWPRTGWESPLKMHKVVFWQLTDEDIHFLMDNEAITRVPLLQT